MADSSYQVIARRWRPQQFSELVGQDHVVKTLANAIELGRIAHAYLLWGQEVRGKLPLPGYLLSLLTGKTAPLLMSLLILKLGKRLWMAVVSM